MGLFMVIGPGPVLASSVLVPDDFASVQSAINSGADTVQVRVGTYAERPIVDHPLVLEGLGSGPHPRLGGLEILNSNFWPVPPLLTVNQVDFSAAVHHTTVYYRPRLLQLGFSECSLDSGFYQLAYMDAEDVLSLTFRNCRLGGHSSARADEIVMDADTVNGSVSWDTNFPSISNCWFTGGPGTAIDLHGMPGGMASGNRIENYDTGIYVQDANECTAKHNTIRACGVGVAVQGGNLPQAVGNTIEDCDIGIDVSSGQYILVEDNRVMSAREVGVRAMGTQDIAVRRNVVGRCAGAGILLQWDPWAVGVTAEGNTVFGNGGAGLDLVRLPSIFATAVTVKANIGASNGGWGLIMEGGGFIQIGCNDWFGNVLGGASGVAADSTDRNVDPLFCNVDSADVRLNSASALLADSASCGQIGALGVGCGVTPTLVQRFTAARVSAGVRVVWQVAQGATASGVWVERSDGGSTGPWVRPATERSAESGATVELDRSADPQRTYWYRLMAQEGSQTVVIGAPIVVEAQAPLEFRLTEVGPNPGSGPVRIAFALKHAAAIGIEVFDVQGRRVASPVSGVWAAGAHELTWDGRTRSGQPVPAGMYIIRYLYPGGQDRRGIVRVR